MGFTREELQAHRGRTVPDLLPEPLRLLFVGINPSLRSAATGAHFSGSGNRFYPALHRAGITRHLIRASDGFSADDLAELRSRGIGITNLWPEATARADELTRSQIRSGLARVESVVQEHRPAVAAVVGITAYRVAFSAPKAVTGEQESPWPGTRLFAAPNPSGLNAHASVEDLAREYGEIARAAGIELDPPRP